MRTNFTAEQRQDPEIAASETELRRCVHCGFCSAACPTYVLEGNELDSPRGRILLIQDMLEKGGAPAPETVFHLDRCLSCLSCVSACPSGVDYGRLIETARAHIEAHAARPFGERLFRALLVRLLPGRRPFRAGLALGRLAKSLARALPARLSAMLELVPAHAPREAPVAPGVYPAAGRARLRLVLFRGCVQNALAPRIEAAAIRVLTKLGAEVTVPEDAGCCGALSHHLGEEGRARGHARDLIGRVGPLLGEDADHLVVTAAGCGMQLKDYGRLCRTEPALAPFAERLGAQVLDIGEAVEKLGLPRGLTPPRPLALAYQSACALQHGQGIDALPRRLLAAAGYRVLDLPESHLCCGSAGSYNMLEPEIASRLRARKLQAIGEAGAEAVASGNIGCIGQLAPGLAIPIAHSIEWLDWALGGEEPRGLGRPHMASASRP